MNEQTSDMGCAVIERPLFIGRSAILAALALSSLLPSPAFAAIGDWSPRNESTPGWANQPGVIAVPGDFDGNGRSDVAFHRPGSNWATVPVVFSRGNGAWAPQNRSAPGWAHQDGVVAVPGDYNGDGRTDIAFHKPMQGSGWDTVPVLLSNGDGSWTPHNTSAPSWAHGNGVVAIRGDFDGDGFADIAFHRPVSGSGWGTVPALFADGHGGWTARSSKAPTWAHQLGVVAIPGDYDGNHRTDIAFHKPAAGSTWGTVPVLFASGERTWFPVNSRSPGWPHQPGVVAIPGDFDGNGRTDIALHKPIEGSNWGTVPVLFSVGDGTWAAQNKSAPGWAHQKGVIAVAGDYDGNSRTDVAFHRPGSSWGTVPVFFSNGDGGWTPTNKNAPDWANKPEFIAIAGDYDGNSGTDIAFHRPSANGSLTSMPVLMTREPAPMKWDFVLPRHTGNDLNGVHCAGGGVCYAVGSMGTVLKSANTGLDWHEIGPAGELRQLNDIYCANTATCWIVGNQGLLIRTDNGGQSWSRLASGTDRTLHGIFCYSTASGGVGQAELGSPADIVNAVASLRCYAVGDGVLLVSFDGTSWQPDWPTQVAAIDPEGGRPLPPPPVPDLRDVGCGGPDACFAVGMGNTLMKRPGSRDQDTDPAVWQRIESMLDRRDGATEQSQSTINMQSSEEIHCVDAKLCLTSTQIRIQPVAGAWRADRFGAATGESQDFSYVSPWESPQRNLGLSCSGTSNSSNSDFDCWAVGDHGEFELFFREDESDSSNWIARRWNQGDDDKDTGFAVDGVSIPDTVGFEYVALRDISCDADRNCVAVGPVGMIAYKSPGQVWKSTSFTADHNDVQTMTPNPYATAKLYKLGAMSCIDPGHCAVIFNDVGATQQSNWEGEDGVLHTDSDGADWFHVYLDGCAGGDYCGDVELLSCADAQHCMAISNMNWSQYPPTEAGIRKIWSTTNAWAHRPYEVISSKGLRHLVCAVPGTCYANDWYVDLLKTVNNGDDWSVSTLPPLASVIGGPGSVSSLSCPTAETCYVSRDQGEIWTTANGGQSWSEIPELRGRLGTYESQSSSGPRTNIHGYRQLVCPDNRRCYAHGGSGRLARMDRVVPNGNKYPQIAESVSLSGHIVPYRVSLFAPFAGITNVTGPAAGQQVVISSIACMSRDTCVVVANPAGSRSDPGNRDTVIAVTRNAGHSWLLDRSVTMREAANVSCTSTECFLGGPPPGRAGSNYRVLLRGE